MNVLKKPMFSNANEATGTCKFDAFSTKKGAKIQSGQKKSKKINTEQENILVLRLPYYNQEPTWSKIMYYFLRTNQELI